MSVSTNGSSVFCQKPAFGGFGSSPTFFLNSSSSPTQTSLFGSSIQSPQPAFGSAIFGSSTPFGATSQPALGSTSTPAYAATAPTFSFRSSTQDFGQSSSAFGTSSPFGSTTSAFGDQSSAFGSQTPTQATTEMDGSFGQFGTLESISAMSVYKDKSHEELRWEDYQLGDKGGPLASAPQSSFFCSCHSPFGANSSSQPFGSSLSPFGASTSSPFGSSIFGNTQSSPLFSTTTPTNPQSGSTFGQNNSPFGQTGAFSRPSLFGSPSSGLVGSIFSSSASLTSNAPTGFGQTAPSMSTPFQTAQPAQSSGTFSFNFDQTPPGTQTPTQAFSNTAIGKSEFRGRRGGSRVASYWPTSIVDTPPPPPPIQTEKLESISANPLYKDKSHEELRLKDYQLGSSAPTNAQSGSVFGQNTFLFEQTAGFRKSSFFGSHSSGLVGSIFSSMASLKSNAPSLATSMASLTSNAPSLAILTGTVVVTAVVTRWISLRGGRA